ncbi:MAG TPA: sulfite exporter TauE/SafE family protein [Verrucomicrobiae bacterium]|nr:sulfite exporter TauE/SafE family protein [Verrucomicrobiae bacterium]
MPVEFLLFCAVGFLAQLVDGALGMAYGVVSSTVLLAFGVPPAHASASVHAAEVFTTAASGASHLAHRNVNWPAFWRLVIAGLIGGVLGAFILTSIDGNVLRPFVVGYLALMGVVILWRAFKPRTGEPAQLKSRALLPLGGVGGFLDAIGGGCPAPIRALVTIGPQPPRYVIGTVNAAEFIVTVGISATFVIALLAGHWSEADGLLDHGMAVLGLIVGGVVAAPFAGLITKRLPVKTLTAIVGVLVLLLAAYQLSRLLNLF